MDRVSLNFEGEFTRFDRMNIGFESKEKSGMISRFWANDRDRGDEEKSTFGILWVCSGWWYS